jgi:hypothetical protein
MFMSALGVAGSAPLRKLMDARGNARFMYLPTRLQEQARDDTELGFSVGFYDEI